MKMVKCWPEFEYFLLYSWKMKTLFPKLEYQSYRLCSFNYLPTGNFSDFFVVCWCFFKIISFGNTIRVSNSLDPYQARRFVGPDMGQNCFQKLSADEIFMPWLVLLYVMYVEIRSTVAQWLSSRWCIDKLGVFHANQTSMCLDPHLNLGWGWRAEKPV